ncbi:MAG: hypothetical protein H0X37_25165 [Herpetosiphonaceae bacterium]|nr:hypothetical protein [Herpetosiphonaceae bacterium]
MLRILPSLLERGLILARRPSRHDLTPAAQSDEDPPQFAKYLLYFIPKKDRDPIIGDLHEEYVPLYQQCGKKRAQIWYWSMVIRSFWPLVSTILQKLIKWGVFGWLGKLLRHLIS